MTRARDYGETWVYESLVGAIPGLSLPVRDALALQFVLFEVGIVLVAGVYGLWSAVPAGTAAVLVATAGSAVMLALARGIRALPAPEAYRRLLFGTRIELVLGLLAYVALVTYLFVVDPRRPGPSFVRTLFGPRPPAVPVYLGLLVLWDVCYRIGTAWWASVTGAWRTLRYRHEFDGPTRLAYRRLDLLTIGFAGVQLVLLPFVWGRPVFVVVLVGHVVAVTVVSGTSVLLLSTGAIAGTDDSRA